MFVIYNVGSRQFMTKDGGWAKDLMDAVIFVDLDFAKRLAASMEREHPVACEHIVVLDWVR